ncbi:eukaryotic translation initiation factor 5B [Rhizina undulata]
MGKHKERANAWENENVPDPIAEATKKAKEAEKAAEDSTPAVVTADEEFGGGGLLGAIKKSAAKKKKGKGGKNAKEEEPIPEPAVEASPEPEAEEKEYKAPVAVTEISEDEFGPVKKGKKGKKGKGGAAPAPAPPPQKEAEDQDEGEGKDEDEDKDEEDDKDEQDRTGRVKTKKEKEKEKKERQKQKKKEQAAKKKAGTAEPAKVGEAKEAPKVAEKDAPAAETAGGKGKKKLPAALALLQKQQEERRRLEEEQRRFEEEERLRIEEEERLLAEEERKKEELKARKKEKEREKKEQLKREGKYLTKAQKEAQQKAQLRLQQMREAGIIVEGLDNADAATKKPVYDKKKKKGGDKKDQKAKEEEEEKKKEAERLEVEKKVKEEEERKKKEEEEAAAAKAAQEAEAAALKKEAEDVLDDWEAAVDEDGNIKESWDMETDEEDEDEKKEAKEEVKKEEKGQKPANGGAKAAPAGRKQVQEDSEEDSDEDSDEEDISTAKRQAAQRKEEAAARRQRQIKEAKAAASTDNLRSPICCILGHVDTGKTKLLDKIRQTNVQEGEAGGITQQIGATYFPMEAIKQKTQVVNQDGKMEYKVPGLLVIDTPGHESFTNLRSRGSSLCNIAILVVDIMHGLEPQTIESIQLLRDRKTPFIVALNKIDRLYGWNPIPDNGFKESLAKQKKSVQTEFRDRLDKTILAFQEQGLNSALFYENKNMGKNISLVPTSAHSGEGIPDMLKLLVTLTQQRMAEKLMYLSELECTVLEVKVIEGLGTTIDVILSNGVLREGDRIVLCGLNGAISTNVRALLTPQPLKELRIKSQYVHNKEVKAALGVKIAANDLEHAIAGSRLMVVSPDDDEEDLEEEVMSDLEQLLGKVSTTGKGVAVQASTLGSLEALLEFLRVSKIPVSTISIGPVYKRDVMRAGTMLEKNKEFAVMLCFDVKIDKDAQQYAEEVGVKIFTANIIYHLFDAFTAYQKEMLELKRKETADQAVFPCVLSPVAVFNKRDPIIIGVDVIEGSLRIGTPIAAVKKNPLTGEMEPVLLGRVTSMHLNQKAVPLVKKGQPSVAVKIEGANQPLYGRHLEEKDTLYSHISRRTIDTLKNHFREEVAKEDWQLLINLKKVFNVT